MDFRQFMWLCGELPEIVDVGLEVNGDMRLLFGKIFDSCLGDIWCTCCDYIVDG